MIPETDDPRSEGEAAESLKKVAEHLAAEDDLLKKVQHDIKEAEQKRHEAFDPSS